MSQFKIAWLPGDGVGRDVMEAARIVLDAMKLDAEYLPGDIGWEFWPCRKRSSVRSPGPNGVKSKRPSKKA